MGRADLRGNTVLGKPDLLVPHRVKSVLSRDIEKYFPSYDYIYRSTAHLLYERISVFGVYYTGDEHGAVLV